MAEFKDVMNKLEVMDKRLDNIDVTLAKQEVSLAIHIKRTALLEEKLEPIDTHVKMVDGIIKFIGFIAILAGIYQALKR